MSEEDIKELFKMSPGAILENYKFMQKKLEQLDKYKEVLDKIKEELKKHKPDLDYEPWSEYKISGNILFDIVKILEEIE